MAELTLQYTFTDRGGAKVYDVISKHIDSDETEIDFCLGQVRIPEDTLITELRDIRARIGYTIHGNYELTTLEEVYNELTSLLEKHDE